MLQFPFDILFNFIRQQVKTSLQLDFVGIEMQQLCIPLQDLV